MIIMHLVVFYEQQKIRIAWHEQENMDVRGRSVGGCTERVVLGINCGK